MNRNTSRGSRGAGANVSGRGRAASSQNVQRTVQPPSSRQSLPSAQHPRQVPNVPNVGRGSKIPVSQVASQQVFDNRNMEIMYPEKVENVLAISEELNKKYDHLVKEKMKMEENFRRQIKTLMQEKVSLEENYKVLEEMVNDGNDGNDGKLEKVEEELSKSRKQVAIMEQRHLKLTNDLKEAQGKNVTALTMKKELEALLEGERSKQQQLCTVVEVLEKSLEEEKSKAKASHENNQFKKLYEDSQVKLKMEQEKYKKLSQDSQERLQVEQEKLKTALEESSEPKKKLVELQEKINKMKMDYQEKMEKVKSNHEEKLNKIKSVAKEKLIEKEKSRKALEAQKVSLEKELSSCKSNLESVNNVNGSLQSQIESLKNEQNESSSKYQLLLETSAKDVQNKMEVKEKEHFDQVNKLQLKIQKLEKNNIEELSKLEDEWVQKMASVNSQLDKNKIKLKVSEDMMKKVNDDKDQLQGEIVNLKQSLESFSKLENELLSKTQENEELSTRCFEAEKRVEEMSDAVDQRDNSVSYKLRLEYQVNHLKEELRRIKNGVVLPVPAEVPEVPVQEPEIDENEMFLRYLDTDTSEIIQGLKTKLIEKDEKIAELETVVKNKESEVASNEEIVKDMISMEDAVGALQDFVENVDPVGISFNLHKEKIEGLNRKFEIKESEVLYVKSELEIVESTKFKMEEEIKCLKDELLKKNDVPSQEENNKMAFTQCGVMDPSEKEADQKISVLEKTLEEKEDHFTRELEVLKLKNKTLLEELDQVKSRTKDDRETSVAQLEDKLQKVTEDYEKLVEDYKNFDEKEMSLNESIQELEDRLKAKDLELEKEREKGSFLNESLEIEKVDAESFRKEKDDLEQQKAELQGQILALKEGGNPQIDKTSKAQKLEIETLKSELERTKIKLKEAQLASIKVHEDLFLEHEEILETVKSLSAKKRKRLFEDIKDKTKKLRTEEVPETPATEAVEDIPVTEESHLLDDTIDNSFNDPKDNIAVTTIEMKQSENVEVNELNLDKIEFIVDQEIKSQEAVVTADVGMDLNEINLDEAEFVMSEAPEMTSLIEPSAPTTILHSSWV